MKNRIQFANNPWPDGHLIKELEWTARIDPKTGLWFDLHLVSDDYFAEDDDSEEEDEEDPESDWAAKDVWSNYHNCILSSTYWGHSGFHAATEKEPLDFANLATRTFKIDPLPPANDPYKRAFGIYLLGHDGVADHEIQFAPLANNKYQIKWCGKIAMEYVGDDSFDHTFKAHYDQLVFSGIQLPEGTDESQSMALANRFVSNAGAMTLTKRDNNLWLIPS